MCQCPGDLRTIRDSAVIGVLEVLCSSGPAASAATKPDPAASSIALVIVGPETATCVAASISQMLISCSTTDRPDGQQQRRAAGLYAVVLLVGNVIISAVKPKVHAHCPFPSLIA